MTQKKSNVQRLSIALFFIAGALSTNAQSWKCDQKINVLFGLSQPILAHGFNIEGNYVYHRFIFDYSHGASLDFKDNTANPELKGKALQYTCHILPGSDLDTGSKNG